MSFGPQKKNKNIFIDIQKETDNNNSFEEKKQTFEEEFDQILAKKKTDLVPADSVEDPYFAAGHELVIDKRDVKKYTDLDRIIEDIDIIEKELENPLASDSFRVKADDVKWVLVD